MGIEQARLSFAMSAALIGMSLDGIVSLLSGKEWEKEEVERLGDCVEEALTEEAMADPDVNERGRLHFPNLNVSRTWKAKRTCSSPPRSDNPYNLIDENQRRREGYRAQWPTNKAGYPVTRHYVRNTT